MHVPVLLKETLELLDPRSGKVFVDATLGFGGHAAALLEAGARVIGIDQDQEALAAVRERLSGNPGIQVIRDNFANIRKIIKEPVDGILFDLGVSSYQIDEAKRGFSIRFDGPLDMRMDQSQELTAAEIVGVWPQEELTRIFREYGEERFANRIGAKICVMRRACRQAGNANKIETTGQLKLIIEKAIPTWRKRESVTRVFQALRIAVNSELENLKKALSVSPEILKPGGRLAVISYHSLEDRMVKWFFRDQEKSGILKILTKRPIVAKEAEIAANPRARSAKLRGAEKI